MRKKSLDASRASLTLAPDFPDNEAGDEQQYQRFLNAANNLGSHLSDVFDHAFLKVISRVRNFDIGSPVSQVATQASSGIITPSAKSWNRRTMFALSLDTSIIVRLHFVEAMMVLLFNTLDEKQQGSVKQGFGELLAKVDDMETSGVPPGAIQAYRDALSAMQAMLVSNPEPEELAVVLADDFAKISRR
jgi:hypothetical protein